MNVNSLKTKDSFHNYVTIKQSDNTSPIEVLLCDSKGALLSNLNEDCTVSIYDAISKEVRQISEEKINNGVLSFRITNDLFPYTHKLEITTYSGVKFPADDDFQIFVSESHNSKLLNIIKSIPLELALKVVTQQVMDRFNTADESFRTLTESMNSKINDMNSSLLSYIKKGEVSVSDIDFNDGKLDSNAFSDSFLNELSKGNINTTSLLNGSVTTEKLFDKAVTSEKLATDAIDRLSQESLFRAMIKDTMNVVLYPPLNTKFDAHAANVNDKYFSSVLLSSTSPAYSFDPNKIMTINNGGYFFYTVRMVEKFLETRKISIMLENSNVETLIQYRFFDSSKVQIGNITNIPLIKNGYYIIENITIPSNAATIELRVDNRSATKPTTIKNVIISPYFQIGIESERVKSLENSVTALSKELEIVKNTDNKVGVLVRKPNGFNGVPYQLNNRIYKDSYGRAFTNYDVIENKLYKGTIYYVDYVNGNDLNDGLTKSSALKSFKAAIDKSDVGEVCLKGGKHFRINAAWPSNFSRAINITSYDGIAQLILADELEWSLVSGYSDVYSITRSGTGKVIDLSRKLGTAYVEFKQVNSIDEVQSTVDSYYTDGTTVYANYSKKPLKNDLVALIRAANIYITAQTDYFYIENVELIGGRAPYHNESEVSEEYFKNVKFLHSVQYNGIELVGGKTAILQDCVASSNYTDGFNYHIGATGSKPNIAEIYCLAEENGFAKGQNGGTSNNGSTLHDGLKGVRIGGTYIRNDGGNIADVNAGTQSWNLNTTAGESYQNADFLLSGSEAWFDGCVCYGSKQGLQVGNSGTAYVRNSEFQHELVAEGSSKTGY